MWRLWRERLCCRQTFKHWKLVCTLWLNMRERVTCLCSSLKHSELQCSVQQPSDKLSFPSKHSDVVPTSRRRRYATEPTSWRAVRRTDDAQRDSWRLIDAVWAGRAKPRRSVERLRCRRDSLNWAGVSCQSCGVLLAVFIWKFVLQWSL